RQRALPVLARVKQPGPGFRSVASFAAPVLLDHHVGDFIDAFVTRKPPLACQALAPPANGIALLAFTRIDDFILQMAAERALHLFYSTGTVLSSLKDSP